MSLLTADVRYAEARNRLTVAFRSILAIPHAVVLWAWTIFAEILSVPQWFIVVFTGSRNQGIWDLQSGWLQYSSHVTAYQYLLFDEYPAFGTDQRQTPMTVDLPYEEPANRLTNGLRFIWAIPALIVVIVIGIGLVAVVVVSWFAILITGRHPRGMYDFLLTGMRYVLQVNAYTMLMTDTYPKWGTSARCADEPCDWLDGAARNGQTRPPAEPGLATTVHRRAPGPGCRLSGERHGAAGGYRARDERPQRVTTTGDEDGVVDDLTTLTAGSLRRHAAASLPERSDLVRAGSRTAPGRASVQRSAHEHNRGAGDVTRVASARVTRGGVTSCASDS